MWKESNAYFVQRALPRETTTTEPIKLYAITLMLRSEKVEAFWRLMISSNRGCFQEPVMGVEGAEATFEVFVGVDGREGVSD